MNCSYTSVYKINKVNFMLVAMHEENVSRGMQIGIEVAFARIAAS